MKKTLKGWGGLALGCGLVLGAMAPAWSAERNEPPGNATSPAERARVTPEDAERLAALATRAFGKGSAKSPAAVSAAIDALIADPSFPDLPDEVRAFAFAQVGSHALDQQAFARARDYYLLAVSANSTNGNDWIGLAWAEYRLGEFDPAGAHLAEMARRWPDVLAQADEGFIYGLLHAMDVESASRLDLLQALTTAGFNKDTPDADYIWLELASMQAERGQRDRARAAIQHLTAPRTLLRLRSDRRFDGLYDTQSPAMDVARMARLDAERWVDRSAASPRDLSLAQAAASALLVVGDAERVLRVIESTLAQPQHAWLEPDSQVWLLNDKSIALSNLGRWNEAAEVLRMASRLAENGQVNVSQAINLGGLECRRGEWKAAQAAIGTLGELSEFGRAAADSVRHCAALGRGDRAGADAALASMSKDPTIAPELLLTALLLESRTEQAATVLIQALASKSERGDALVMIQDYREPLPTAEDQRLAARWDAMLEREDVKAAIDAVGRRTRYDIFRP